MIEFKLDPKSGIPVYRMDEMTGRKRWQEPFLAIFLHSSSFPCVSSSFERRYKKGRLPNLPLKALCHSISFCVFTCG